MTGQELVSMGQEVIVSTLQQDSCQIHDSCDYTDCFSNRLGDDLGDWGHDAVLNNTLNSFRLRALHAPIIAAWSIMSLILAPILTG